MRIKAILILLFLSTLAVRADDINSDNYLRLGMEHGLSQSFIHSIIQDKTGFMWFGTNDGLNRYDGYTFKTFYNNLTDNTSISNNQVRKLALAPNGCIWAGTMDGLNCYDPETGKFKRYFIHTPSSKNINVNSLMVDKEGIIWFSYKDDPYLICLNPKTGKSEYFKLPAPKNNHWAANRDGSFILYANTLIENHQGLFWIGTNQGTIILFDKSQKKFIKQYTISEQIPISSIVEMDNQRLCVTTVNKGFCFVNTNTGKQGIRYNLNPTLPKSFYSNIFCMIKDKRGNLFIGTLNDYLYYFDVKQKKIHQILFTQSTEMRLSPKGVCSLFIDKSGILWCGATGYGIYYLNPYSSSFHTITQGFHFVKGKYKFQDLEIYAYDRSKTHYNSISFQSVRGIYATNDYIWAGGYKGFDRIDRQTGNITNICMEIIPYTISPDPDEPSKYLWIGEEAMGNPLKRLNIKTNKLEKTKLNCSYILSIYADKNHILWIGTSDQLIKYNTLTGSNIRYWNIPGDPYSLQSGAIKTITRDKAGKLWIGSDIDGVSMLDEKTGRFIHYRHQPNNNNSLTKNAILYIAADNANNLWIGTNGGGINKLDNQRQKFSYFTTTDGLPNNVVYAIIPDQTGNMWISTNKGICRLNPTTKEIKCWDAADGLQGNEFNASSYFKDTQGTIFFGGIYGMTFFSSENMLYNFYKPDVILSSVKIDNEEIVSDKPLYMIRDLNFSYKTQIITIGFSALSYFQSYKNEYAYKISGGSNKWIPLGTCREITFNGLKEGNYTLQIIASNNDGEWNTKPLILYITISPPYWKTWWFYLLITFIAVIVVLSIFRYRIITIKRLNKLLSKQIDERTEEIVKQKEKIELQNKNLAITNEELHKANISKDKFFSIIAHDLKSPFNSILGFSELLSDEFDNFDMEEKKSFAHNINEASLAAVKLLENLLEWARMQTGKIEFNPKNIDLSNIVVETLSLLHSFAHSKNIKLTSSIGFNTMVFADENMIKTVMRNLVSNAIKFTPVGGEVKIMSVNKENTIEISVKDNGVGISQEDVELLFQIDKSFKRVGTNNETGTGLGLILCKEFVERNGGSIHIESTPGIGSIFTFTLPTA